MKEEELARWVDLARGVLSEAEVPDAERVLAANERARAAFEAFRAVERVAACEAAPPGSIALAKSLALLEAESHEGESHEGGWRSVPFRVVFDSLAAPLVAGQRSGVSPSRELHLAADGLFVDVRVDRARDSRSAVVVGEVLDGEESRKPLRDVAVRVVAEGEILAETSSGDFGEFYLDLPFRPDMVLNMLLAERSFLSVNLSRPELAAEGS